MWNLIGISLGIVDKPRLRTNWELVTEPIEIPLEPPAVQLVAAALYRPKSPLWERREDTPRSPPPEERSGNVVPRQQCHYDTADTDWTTNRDYVGHRSRQIGDSRIAGTNRDRSNDSRRRSSRTAYGERSQESSRRLCSSSKSRHKPEPPEYRRRYDGDERPNEAAEHFADETSRSAESRSEYSSKCNGDSGYASSYPHREGGGGGGQPQDGYRSTNGRDQRPSSAYSSARPTDNRHHRSWQADSYGRRNSSSSSYYGRHGSDHIGSSRYGARQPYDDEAIDNDNSGDASRKGCSSGENVCVSSAQDPAVKEGSGVGNRRDYPAQKAVDYFNHVGDTSSAPKQARPTLLDTSSCPAEPQQENHPSHLSEKSFTPPQRLAPLHARERTPDDWPVIPQHQHEISAELLTRDGRRDRHDGHAYHAAATSVRNKYVSSQALQQTLPLAEDSLVSAGRSGDGHHIYVTCTRSPEPRHEIVHQTHGEDRGCRMKPPESPSATPSSQSPRDKYQTPTAGNDGKLGRIYKARTVKTSERERRPSAGDQAHTDESGHASLYSRAAAREQGPADSVTCQASRSALTRPDGCHLKTKDSPSGKRAREDRPPSADQVDKEAGLSHDSETAANGAASRKNASEGRVMSSTEHPYFIPPEPLGMDMRGTQLALAITLSSTVSKVHHRHLRSGYGDYVDEFTKAKSPKPSEVTPYGHDGRPAAPVSSCASLPSADPAPSEAHSPPEVCLHPGRDPRTRAKEVAKGMQKGTKNTQECAMHLPATSPNMAQMSVGFPVDRRLEKASSPRGDETPTQDERRCDR